MERGSGAFPGARQAAAAAAAAPAAAAAAAGKAVGGACEVVVEGAGVPHAMKQSLSRSLGRVVPSYPIRVCMHILSLLAVLLIAANSLSGTATIRGSFCNNTDIALPKKKGSISLGKLMMLSFLMPALLIIFVECLIALVRVTQAKDDNSSSSSSSSSSRNEVQMFGFPIPQFIVDLYTYLGGLGFCMGAAWMIADSLKCYVGSLRPHFFSACNPDWSKVQCKGAHEEYIYVEDFHCQNPAHMVEDARRSFPSGHSTYISCGMVYAVLYLQARLRWQQQQTAPRRCLRQQQQQQQGRACLARLFEYGYWLLQAVTPALQVLLLLLGVYVPATRVLEHFHHVRDVCTGMFLGTSSAIFGAFFIADMRRLDK
ncbi:hypothetical protein, conserved [Eimeria brunetti]|uniref:Phosphatidic acid phosphatase type 2/haloperoxidase domain-containing protein n=1 Tax=Eimeria brunetti TaxID=51314 RepID=U6LSJ1_9EIME|nr:hypothetical protein, conserved [Eimeria brunetti]